MTSPPASSTLLGTSQKSGVPSTNVAPPRKQPLNVLKGIPDALCTVDIAGAVAYISQVVGQLRRAAFAQGQALRLQAGPFA